MTIRLTEAQLEYLSYLYPDEDPEEALVKLLECDRLRALRRAERKVMVLHFDEERDGDHLVPAISVDEAALLAESKNPIGVLPEQSIANTDL